MCTVVSSHSCIPLAYLFCLAGVKPTVLLLRFQVKPIKTGDEEKGVSLESSCYDWYFFINGLSICFTFSLILSQGTLISLSIFSQDL